MGAEEVIEEAFVDVFCDLIYGGGWMDVERGEEADRECNWALVCICTISFVFLPLTDTPDRVQISSGDKVQHDVRHK